MQNTDCKYLEQIGMELEMQDEEMYPNYNLDRTLKQIIQDIHQDRKRELAFRQMIKEERERCKI